MDGAIAKLLEAAEAIRSMSSSEDNRGHEGPGFGPSKKPKKENDVNANKIFEQYYSAMQTKLDKVIRQLDTLTENQKKMSKMIQSLVKDNKRSVDESGVDRDESESFKKKRKIAGAGEENNGAQKSLDSTDLWAHNLFLVGDNHWKGLREVDDINVEITQLEKESNLKIMSTANEEISSLYDPKRKKVLFAVPLRTTKIAISIGSQDLFQKDLLTLKEASLEEVRKHNEPILREKSSVLCEMFHHLLNMHKTVIFLLPPLGEERLEVFKHWEDIMLKEMSNIQSNKFKVINLPFVMRKTMTDFTSMEEFHKMWLKNSSDSGPRKYLSAYGNRRLYDLLQKNLRIRHNQSRLGVHENCCLRCLKLHPGAEEFCKSKDKACRRCDKVGHFDVIHDAIDPTLRMRLATFYGEDLFGPVENGISKKPPPLLQTRSQGSAEQRKLLSLSGANLEPLPTKRGSSSNNREELLPSLDDWYHH